MDEDGSGSYSAGILNVLRAGGRFEVTQSLGVGGMGLVYEAYDRERGLRVALKTLRHLNPAALFRFKREFRALADVTHRNLVSLYELIEYNGRWFFTMELVEGIDFLSYVRGGRRSPHRASGPALAP